MAKCERCGKSLRFGHNVSHSKHRTKRQWKPNIQRTTVIENGRTRRMYLCTQCIRTLQKTV
ncbi:MAG: 50S ribosomal protein L28 [Chloroflexi bacterium]|nr:50S ribosomal protein L28 [Chloroflexota bacterium]